MANNPFLNVKRKHNSMYAERTMLFGFLKVVTLFSLSILLIGIGGFIHISSKSKFIPYVIQKDMYGNNEGFVVLDHIPKAEDADFENSAKRFIESIRMVTTDHRLQNKAMETVYSFITETDNAKNKVNSFYTASLETSPYKRAEKETVSIEDIVALKNTDTTWQVDWTEKTFDTNSGEMRDKPEKKRALLQIYQGDGLKKMKEKDLLNNPHAIFVRDFDWSNVD